VGKVVCVGGKLTVREGGSSVWKVVEVVVMVGGVRWGWQRKVVGGAIAVV